MWARVATWEPPLLVTSAEQRWIVPFYLGNDRVVRLTDATTRVANQWQKTLANTIMLPVCAYSTESTSKSFASP